MYLNNQENETFNFNRKMVIYQSNDRKEVSIVSILNQIQCELMES